MEQKAVVAHVLIFPFPAQGHINSMLQLAELLCLSDIHVTFVNTHHYHNRLFRFTDAQTRFASYPKFRFETISDGLPDEHPRSVSCLKDIFDGVKNVMQPCFWELMVSESDNNAPPLTCIIFDGLLSFPVDVAKHFGIPSIAFRTTSACYLWATFHLTNLLQAGQVPFSDDDMDKLVTCIPGMETFVRNRDLPSFYRGKDPSDPSMHGPSSATTNSLGASASILNTFQHLESPILSFMAPHFPKIHAIGPLHTLLAVRRPPSPPISSNSLWKIDTSCITWLDSQSSKSVVYVSFGSLVLMTHHQMLEFWYGLVKSGKRFLWVVRPDSVIDKDDIPVELVEATKERGYMVEWSPQEQVLAHPAVGGFVTHSGWNSTLESIVAGVPMLCWPCMGDQQINSRFVSDFWKIGFDMKDTCNRFIVEKMVNDLMVDRRDEVMRAMDEISSMATKSVTPGGSSYCNFESLIDDLKNGKLEA